MKYTVRTLLFGLGLALLPFAPSLDVLAASPGLAKPSGDVETRIVADKMTYQSDKQQVVFDTKVHVTRPDFELWSDKLTVYMKPAKTTKSTEDKKPGSLPEGMAAGDVDRLVAQGQVRMKSEGREGTSSKATYTVDDGVLVMEGDPKVSDGDNVITGEIIRYYTKENRSEVVGGAKKRVEAVFSTSSKPTREGKR